MGPVHAGRPLCADKVHPARASSRRTAHLMAGLHVALHLLRLLRPARPRRYGVVAGLARRWRRWWNSSSQAAAAARTEPTAPSSGLGLRSHLLWRSRRQLASRPGPRQHHPPGGRHACQRPHSQCQLRRAARAHGTCAPAWTDPGIPLGTADGLAHRVNSKARGHGAGLLEHRGARPRPSCSGDEFGIRALAKLAVRAGVTTATDLAPTASVDAGSWTTCCSVADRRGRLSPAASCRCSGRIGGTPAEAVARAVELARAKHRAACAWAASRRCADGSIQGFSARLRWPGYYNGAPNGLWYTAPRGYS
jgi:hypothetical protein